LIAVRSSVFVGEDRAKQRRVALKAIAGNPAVSREGVVMRQRRRSTTGGLISRVFASACTVSHVCHP
jgi:hypothetical protein